jgi:hypothetical protein
LIPHKIPTSRFDWGINFIAVRYTDILLLKAECVLNGASGSQATDVDAVVNQVRTRAGLLPLTGVTLAQLYDERRKSLRMKERDGSICREVET